MWLDVKNYSLLFCFFVFILSYPFKVFTVLLIKGSDAPIITPFTISPIKTNFMGSSRVGGMVIKYLVVIVHSSNTAIEILRYFILIVGSLLFFHATKIAPRTKRISSIH